MGVLWMLSPSKRPTSTSECSLMSEEDSNHTELMLKKLNSNFAELSPNKLERPRFHTSLPMMEELLDSHIQTLTKMIPLRSILLPEPLNKSLSLPTTPLLSLPEETILVELVSYHLLRSIQVLMILHMSKIPEVMLSPQESLTFSSLVT